MRSALLALATSVTAVAAGATCAARCGTEVGFVSPGFTWKAVLFHLEDEKKKERTDLTSKYPQTLAMCKAACDSTDIYGPGGGPGYSNGRYGFIHSSSERARASCSQWVMGRRAHCE